eukprot:14907-Chlamydomonas_euryale.AAC.1
MQSVPCTAFHAKSPTPPAGPGAHPFPQAGRHRRDEARRARDTPLHKRPDGLPAGLAVRVLVKRARCRRQRHRG